MRNTVDKLLVLLFLIPMMGVSQKKYKPPKHALGFEVNWSRSVLGEYRNNSDLPVYFSAFHNEGYGGSIALPYQYTPKSSFFGLQSGLGFFMWGTSYRKSGSIQTVTESLYSVGIPLVAQFKVARMFWLEAGLQTNFAVYNTLRDKGAWNRDTEPRGRLPLAELQSVIGFRYHFFRTFSFKVRAHYGLTPAYRRVLESYNPGTEGVYTLRYRFVVIEMGLSYLFPLKK